MDEQKMNVALVVLNKDSLDKALFSLNEDHANLVAVVVDDTESVTFGDAQVPTYPFSSIDEVIALAPNYEPQIEEDLADSEETAEDEGDAEVSEDKGDNENSKNADDKEVEEDKSGEKSDDNKQTEELQPADEENDFEDTNTAPVEVEKIPEVEEIEQTLIWLICGGEDSELEGVQKFLMASGIKKKNIVNFEIFTEENETWIGNLRYAESNQTDFFATGNSLVQFGLDFDYPLVDEFSGVNLASANQDLQQSLATAKHIFEHAEPNSIRFVIIGIDLNSFNWEYPKSFSTNALKYDLTLKSFKDKSRRGKFLKYLTSFEAMDKIYSVTEDSADIDYKHLQESCDHDFTAEKMLDMEKNLSDVDKKFDNKLFNKNYKTLEDYIKLCKKYKATPVVTAFPWIPRLHQKYNSNYDKKFFFMLRKMLNQLTKIYDCPFVDLSFGNGTYPSLGFKWFYDMEKVHHDGARLLTGLLAWKLYDERILSMHGFEQSKYDILAELADRIPQDKFKDLMNKLFKLTLKKLRLKKKIKVGFVLDNASMWCGDELYNYFAQDERFEPTVFSILHRHNKSTETVVEDWKHGIEQFKNSGLNVVGVSEVDAPFPHQDILIFLRPYMYMLPDTWQFSEISPDTLIVTIPYGFRTSAFDIYNLPVFHLAWKMFFDSDDHRQEHELNCTKGAAKHYYSGFPKLDVFFEEKNSLHYDWKMTRPDATKIIYAPHWSIDEGVMYSTFQWNYQFMFDFAKNHPETSWVIKPHPSLLNSAVRRGLFPSVEAFEEYLQAWDNLPNAKLETGAYYQAIFATSDGMIQDCSSFIGEYQYTHKPMIFLTRDTQVFNDLGNELMEVIYCVDGQDLKGIEDMMQKIFIDKQDPWYDKRMEFFDKYCNYKKLNGMSASEYVFRTIAKDLK